MFTFDYVRLLVQDFSACFRFYRDVLGFEAKWGAADDVYAEFNSGGVTIALFKREFMAEVVGTMNKPASAEQQDAAVLIFSVVDVDAAVRRLRDAGVPAVTEPQDRPDWGIRTAHFRDPDGNLIEINAPLPREET